MTGSDGTGSSAIDTLLQAPAIALNMLALFIGGLGGDLGSTGSAGSAELLPLLGVELPPQ